MFMVNPSIYCLWCANRVQSADASESLCHSFSKVLCLIILFITILSSEGYPGVSQSSVAGYSQLPFPAASQAHWRSSTEGRWEILEPITCNKFMSTSYILVLKRPEFH